VTLLDDGKPDADGRLVAWGRAQGVRRVPLGVFTDGDGPPAYRLARDAEVTVLLFVRQKVVLNYAFRPGELTPAAAAEVVAAVPRLLAVK
jgi:hypothetical protein